MISFLLAGNMVPVSLLFSLSGQVLDRVDPLQVCKLTTNTWPFLTGACVLQEDCVLWGGGERECVCVCVCIWPPYLKVISHLIWSKVSCVFTLGTPANNWLLSSWTSLSPPHLTIRMLGLQTCSTISGPYLSSGDYNPGLQLWANALPTEQSSGLADYFLAWASVFSITGIRGLSQRDSQSPFQQIYSLISICSVMPSFLAIIVLNSDTIFKTKFRARINNSSHNVSPVIFAAHPLFFFSFSCLIWKVFCNKAAPYLSIKILPSTSWWWEECAVQISNIHFCSANSLRKLSDTLSIAGPE